MIYVGFTYGYILLHSMKDKNGTSIWNLSWLFLVWLVPTAIPHSRAKSKGWTSGGVTECKRQ